MTAGASVEIPVLDIGPALTGEGTAAVVDALRHACVEVGFLQIVGHGVPRDLIDEVYSTAGLLRRLSPADKASLTSPTGHHFRGLVARRDDEGRPLVESLQVNTYDDADAAVADGVDPEYADYFHPNVWPDIPGIRDAWVQCAAHTRSLGRSLIRLFALALALPEGHFDSYFANDVTQFGINWYPPQPVCADFGAEIEPRVLQVAHADSGVLTVLHQRGDYEGLQVRTQAGSWANVPVLDDAFVVNIGELMSRWTNGRWPATVHRVVAGPDPNVSRTSVVTFVLPSVDTVIAPLPTTVGEDGSLYPPVTPYEWEVAYISRLGYQPPERRRRENELHAG
jgi:isopenicillin N synthase-like dioxygenase